MKLACIRVGDIVRSDGRYLKVAAITDGVVSGHVIGTGEKARPLSCRARQIDGHWSARKGTRSMSTTIPRPPANTVGLLAAVAYCRLGARRHGKQPAESDFAEALRLGLLAHDPCWRATQQGEGLLIACGLLESAPAREMVTVHALWARHVGEHVAGDAQLVGAFSDGLVECYPDTYAQQRQRLQDGYGAFFDDHGVEDLIEFFVTVEQLERPPAPAGPFDGQLGGEA